MYVYVCMRMSIGVTPFRASASDTMHGDGLFVSVLVCIVCKCVCVYIYIYIYVCMYMYVCV